MPSATLFYLRYVAYLLLLRAVSDTGEYRFMPICRHAAPPCHYAFFRRASTSLLDADAGFSMLLPRQMAVAAAATPF